ncbi:MAG: class I SAM-dependent methyltransferase [Candidatus Caldatribacteriota bacterium]|nr:class I SAM-dependent methyltransferase [Candidatus Caldatribacteriota bacterium]
MKSNYGFTAKIYDPIFYLPLKSIRIAVMNELLKYKEKVILDLCCGTGNQLNLLSKHGFRNLYCLDISDSMLEIVKRSNSSIKIYNENAIKTSFNNASFDVVIISFAIHEKDRNTQQALIDEAYRIIKKDGFMLVVDYVFDNKTTKFGRIVINIIERIAGGEHYINFKSYIQNDGLLSLIEKDKFKLIKYNRMSFGAVTISTYQKIPFF